MSLPNITQMDALSIRQPWPHRIFNEGKDLENRTWWTNKRGLFLIHAGKKFDGTKAENVGYNMGGIVGIAELVDCVSESESEWYTGDYGFVLDNVIDFGFVLPCKGRLGFFRPDVGEITAAIVLKWGEGMLSEGQCCALLGMDRLAFRVICGEAV